MELLEKRILADGKIGEGDVLKVDSFLNHQMDIGLLCEVGKEFRRLFDDVQIDKILTIEASGIGVAAITAQYFNVPMVFAKKSKSSNISADVYTSEVYSYTHKRTYDIVVSKEFLHPGEKVLIIDDFLAKGSALRALMKVVSDAGAETVGAGIVIEKTYQGAGIELRNEGIRVESLARIAKLSVAEGIEFYR
ncbi:MAG: xanthine phosphoribosyltransferase [Clostridia bacterium]|nr:xanthine phosphoribosyltransferase [Clostridia bacterium]